MYDHIGYNCICIYLHCYVFCVFSPYIGCVLRRRNLLQYIKVIGLSLLRCPYERLLMKPLYLWWRISRFSHRALAVLYILLHPLTSLGARTHIYLPNNFHGKSYKSWRSLHLGIKESCTCTNGHFWAVTICLAGHVLITLFNIWQYSV